MSNTITICNNEIQIKEFDNQRVVTFKEIDLVHGRADGTARRNFNQNKQRFIEGVDFFQLTQANEIRTLGITRAQGGTPDKVTLITESGYLMLVKSFTDDLACRNGYSPSKHHSGFWIWKQVTDGTKHCSIIS